MPFVWSIGTIVGPAIGGTFADPHESFPHAFPRGSLFSRFPYLLPNLICAGLLLVSILFGFFLFVVFFSVLLPNVMLPDDTYVSDETPLLETSDAIKRPAVDLRAETYGTFKSRRMSEASTAKWVVQSEKPPAYNIFSKRIMSVVLALSIFTYHSMTYDHLLPIFFEDERAPSLSIASLTPLRLLFTPGGLGLSLRAVGMIMAVNGAIALFIQAVIFPLAAERIGVYRLFILVTVLHPLAYLIVPLLLYLPEALVFPAIYVCLTVRNLFAILVYPLLLILIKEATPSPSILGKVNGMAASAGAACRMVAPPIAGYLYTVGSKMDCTAVAWNKKTHNTHNKTNQNNTIHRDRSQEDGAGENGRDHKAADIAVTVVMVSDSDSDSESD